MPTNITQSESDGRTVLRVDGEMLLDDAILLEKIALDMRAESGGEITVDLADLDFLDSDSATVLKRMQDVDGFRIEGMAIFLQSAIDTAERIG